MNTSIFQIDSTEAFPTLDNAPIVEAVVQFNAPPSTPFQQIDLKGLLAKQFPGYKIRDQMHYEAGILAASNGVAEMQHKSQWDGYRLESEDGKYICQWKRDCLVFSRLRPYETWANLRQAALAFWAAYREVGKPDLMEGIGVRFISQIPLREGERASEYVQQIPPPLKGLGLRADSFFHQDTIPLQGYPYEVRLIRAMQPAAEKSGSKRVLIVDIDVSTTMAVTFDQLDKSLDEMRYIKNKMFFTYMKDADQRFK